MKKESKRKSKGLRKGWTPLSEVDKILDLSGLKGIKLDIVHDKNNNMRVIIK